MNIKRSTLGAFRRQRIEHRLAVLDVSARALAALLEAQRQVSPSPGEPAQSKLLYLIGQKLAHYRRFQRRYTAKLNAAIQT